MQRTAIPELTHNRSKAEVVSASFLYSVEVFEQKFARSGLRDGICKISHQTECEIFQYWDGNRPCVAADYHFRALRPNRNAYRWRLDGRNFWRQPIAAENGLGLQGR